jgi:hypothetical protein
MRRVIRMAAALSLCALSLPTLAQTELRDPLQLPASLRAAAAASAASGAATGDADAGAEQPQQLIFIKGRAYLVVQGRRLGVGDRWGEARILAIDEHAVTLSEAGVKRRLPLYMGVEKKASTAAAERASAPAGGRARKTASEKS